MDTNSMDTMACFSDSKKSNNFVLKQDRSDKGEVSPSYNLD